MPSRMVERLNGMNRTVVFLVVAAVVVAGLIVPGIVGAGLLALVAIGLFVLLRATWHRHDSRDRTARLVVFGLLVLIAAVKLTL